MLHNVKKWLGIEGVKVSLELNETYSRAKQLIQGKVRFETQHTQTVTGLRFVLTEEYTRGRRQHRKTDEYEMARMSVTVDIKVKPEEPEWFEFELPFEITLSEIDTTEANGGLNGLLAKVAKTLHGANSVYRLEVTAKVQGTALSPFDKQYVNLQ